MGTQLLTKSMVIGHTCGDLYDISYREGANDTVLSHCCDNLNTLYPGEGNRFLSLMNDGKTEQVVEEFMDGDELLLEFLKETEEMSRGKGPLAYPR